MRKLISLLLAICLVAALAALAACSLPAAQDLTPLRTATATPGPTPSPTPVPTPTPAPTPEPFGLPNVYMFVLDEYGAFDILEKYYKYDAGPFKSFLAQKGFNISRESYSTDRQTGYCVCDLMNIDHISFPYTPEQVQNAIDNAQLNQVFSGMGYSLFQYSTNVSHFLNVTRLKTEEGRAAYAALALREGFKGVYPSVPPALAGQLSESEFGAKSDTGALNEWGFYPSNYIRGSKAYKNNKEYIKADAMLDIFDWYEDPGNYAPTQKPHVIYSYMAATHVPFLFDEYGGIRPNDDSRNWQDKEIYLGQYKFLYKRLIASVSTIIANDPDSIIIIMSDHGVRYHNKKMRITDKESVRVFNAVYIKGEKHDIEGLSAINTMRYVLSLFEGRGQDFPPVEDHVTSESPDDLTGILPEPVKE